MFHKEHFIMKASFISSVLTALLITSICQPHQNITAAASQNNTDEGANGCIGLHCLTVVDEDEADLFMDQGAARSSRMLIDSSKFKVGGTNNAGKPSPFCMENRLRTERSCLGSSQLMQNGRPCDPHFRSDYPYCKK